jgi:tetrahydromethanopterin S-methyltransferase subunit G
VDRFEALRRDVDHRLDRVHERLDQVCIQMVKPDEFSVVRQRLDRLELDVRELRKAAGL